MTDLNKDMQEVIQKNMPSQVAGELSNIITEWEDMKEDYPLALDKIEKLKKDVQFKEQKVNLLESTIKTLKENSTEVHQRELIVEEKERTLELRLMEKELELVKQAKDDIFKLTDKVFSVPTVTVSNSKNIKRSIPVEGSSNCPGFITDCYDNENETTTTTESK